MGVGGQLRLRRVLVGGALLVGLAAVGSLSAGAAAPRPSISASLEAPPFVGGAQVLRFVVTNTGTVPVNDVEITTQSASTIPVTGCPAPPAGWTGGFAGGKVCRFVNPGGGAAILGGQSTTFQVAVNIAASTANRSTGFTVKPNINSTAAVTVGVTGYSWQLTDAVVVSGATNPVIGGACPATTRIVPTTVAANVVICGVNRSYGAATPSTATLAGTLVASPGTWSTAKIPAGGLPKVLGVWSNATLNGGAGTKTVVASVRSSSSATSPVTTFTGYLTNQPPAAVGDTYTVAEDGTLTVAAPGVLGNDTDPDGDVLTVALPLASLPTHGTVAVAANGSFTYEPAPNHAGADSFTYRAQDANGTSNLATVAITVTPAADAPTAYALTPATVAENQAVNTVVGTLSTTDPDVGDTFTYSLVGGTGATDNASFNISGGQLRTSAIFDLEAKATYSIRIRSTDSAGGSVEGATTITITDVNEAPTDLALDPSSISESQPSGSTVGTLSSTDPDAGGSHTYALVAGEGATDNASFTISGTSLRTAVSLNLESTASYSVRVRTTDQGGLSYEEQVTVTVTNANEAPTDLALAPASVGENHAANTEVGTLSATDPDVGDTHTFTLVAGDGSTDNGSFTITGNKLLTDAVFDLEAKASYSIRVRATDAGGLFTSKQLTVTVTNVNEAPTDLALAPASVAENQAVATEVGTLSATDPDAASSHTFLLVSGAGSTDNASFTIAGDKLLTNAVFDRETKASYSVRVRATDAGTLFFEEQLTIAITDVNEAPVATADSFAVDDGTTTVVAPGVLGNDTDPEGSALTAQLVSGPATATGTGGSFTLHADGSFQYTPATGTAVASDTFTYRAADASSLTSAVTTVTLSFNDPPVAADGTATSAEDGSSGAIQLSASDPDDEPLAFSISAGPTNGSLSAITGTSCAAVDTCTANVTYTPSANFNGSDSFTFQVSDGDSTDTGVVTVTVTEVNDIPVAVDDSLSSVAEDSGTRTIAFSALTGNDAAGPTNEAAQALTVTAVSAPTGGTVSIVGTDVQFVPTGDFNGAAGFSYTVRDDGTTNGAADPKTDVGAVTFTVSPVNDAPTDVALDDATVDENQPSGTIVGTFTATDIDSAAHSFTLVTGTGDTDNGAFQITGGSTLKTSSAFDFEAKSTYSIRVQASDGAGGTFSEVFTITVGDVNDAPTNLALDDSTVDENQAVGTVVGALSATDPDVGNTHTFSLVSGAGSTDNASFQLAGSSLQTKAVFNFEVKASYSIRVRTTDQGGLSVERPLTITIDDVNDAPSAVNDSYSGAIGNTLASRGITIDPARPAVFLTGNVLVENDVDEDGDTLHAVVETVSSTGGGSATISSNGAFTFEPGVGDKNQTDTFTYKVTDGTAQVTGTVTVGISNHIVWYADRDATTNGDGRSLTPFNNLAGLNGAGGAGDADAAGDVLFLHSAASAYTGGLPLEAGQQLIGEPNGLVVNSITVLAASGSNPVIQNAAGTALTLANDVTTRRVSIGTSSGDGISGTSITNADIGGTSTVTGVTGADLKLSGGSGTVTFGPSVTNTAGRSVDVQGRTGGTVTVSGNVTDNGTGVLLDGNTGATIAFTGDLDVTSGTSPAFTATGGGTVTATGSGKTLSTTTGVALRVDSTTIGTAGLTFQSISANGAPSGIVLNATGTTAGLTVTGTGTAPSGGTIQNTTGAGAVLLTNTFDVSLDGMAITGADHAGVFGNELTDFSFADGSIVNAGDSETSDLDSAFAFAGAPVGPTNNIDGELTITGTTITGSFGGSIAVGNRVGTITNATITGNTITSATHTDHSKGDGIILNVQGLVGSVASITRADISGNTITNIPSGYGINILGGNSAGDGVGELAPSGTYGVPGSATDVIRISGNKIRGLAGVNMNGSAISAGVAGRGQGNFVITDNGTVAEPLGNVAGTGIGIGAAGEVTADFVVTGNVLDLNNEFGSDGIGVGSDKNTQADLSVLSAPVIHATVSDNTITHSNGSGIGVLQRDSNGTLHLELEDNTVTNITGSGAAGIVLDNGSSGNVAFNPTMCAAISGNVATGTNDAFNDGQRPGLMVGKRSASATTYVFGIEGLTPSPANPDATETYLEAQNPGLVAGTGLYAGEKAFVKAPGDNFTSCVPDITPPGEAPVIADGSAGATYAEQSATGVAVAGGLTVSDADDTELASATLTISSPVSGDQLQFTNQSGITGAYTSATGVLSLSGSATLAEYQAAIRSVTFRNTSSDNPGASRTITVKVNDGAITSNTVSRTVTITPVNDAPSISVPGAQSGTEDVAKVLSGANAVSVADPDATSLRVHLAATNGTVTLATTAGLTINAGGNGTSTVTFTGSPASVNAALNGLSFLGTANYNVLRAGDSTLAVSVDDQGSTGGGSLIDGDTVTVNLAAVNDAPVAVAKSVTAQANMQLNDVSGMLVGVTDPDSADPGYVAGFTLAGVTPLSCTGCTVSDLDSSAGTYDLDPGPGLTGAHTLQYTVSDNGSPVGPAATSAPATINATFTGPAIWFVDDSAPAGGTGRLSAPFQTVAQVDAVDDPGDRIFLSSGDYAQGLTLQADERLIGQGVTGASFDAVFGITPPAGTITRPTVNGARPTIDGTIALGGNDDHVRGVDLTPAAGAQGIQGTGRTGITIGQVSVVSTNAAAVNLVNSAGTASFTRVDATGGPNGIIWTNASDQNGSLTITGTGTADCTSAATCSGGAIRNTSGPGIILSKLTNADSVTISNLLIENGGDDGISATEVRGIDLANVLVSNNGDDQHESSLDLVNLSGNGSLTASTLDRPGDSNLLIDNSTGSVTFSVTGSSIRDTEDSTTGNDNILVGVAGPANVTLDVTGTTFADARGDHIQVAFSAVASGTVDVTIDGNTFTNDTGGGALGSGLTLGGSGSSQVRYDVSNNTITGAVAQSINVAGLVSTDAQQTRATIHNNTIGSASVLDSGGATGISLYAATASDLRVAITDNEIHNWSNPAGAINIITNDTCGGGAGPCPPGGINVTLTGNTIADPGTFANDGMVIESGNEQVLCASIGGAGVLRNDVEGDEADGGTDIRVRQGGASTFRLPGYTGPALGGGQIAGVTSYLTGRNAITSVDVATPQGTGYLNSDPAGSACLLP